VPPIVVVFNVVPDEAPADWALVGAGVLEELDELAHAVTASTAAARLAAVNSFRMGRSLLTPYLSPVGDHVAGG
jgi:hypothetical protein